MFEQDVERSLEVLRKGGVIAYPTDTIWGLGCDALNADAIEKIYHIKRRPSNKSMIILLAEARDLFQYVADPHPAVFDLIEESQVPITVIFEHPLQLPEVLLAADGSIGIRIVRDEFCRHLIKRLRAPLVSTSANFSGEPSPRIFSEIDPKLLEQLDYVVEHRREETQPTTPSRIVKLLKDGELQYIR